MVLSRLGFEKTYNLCPGEMLLIKPKFTANTKCTSSKCTSSKCTSLEITRKVFGNPIYTPCLFEYIYLADENSVIDGISVDVARTTMGRLVSSRMISKYSDSTNICIVPIPSTPNRAAKEMSDILGTNYVDLIDVDMMDRKSSRTFILPTQNARKTAVYNKFSIKQENLKFVENVKHIILVDDSIVRGTTIRRIIALIKEYVNPKKITIVSLAPAIRYENIYGIDIPDRNTLIAHNKTEKEIANDLCVDEVLYGDLNEITRTFINIAKENGIKLQGFESSVFIEK
jgi:amidophosphoribosyltransferase